VAVGIGVWVLVGVAVGVWVTVGVWVAVWVAVGLAVRVRVGVGVMLGMIGTTVKAGVRSGPSKTGIWATSSTQTTRS
jgi:hypothetical protein